MSQREHLYITTRDDDALQIRGTGTYTLKNELRNLQLQWDPLHRVWEIEGSANTITYVISEIENLAAQNDIEVRPIPNPPKKHQIGIRFDEAANKVKFTGDTYTHREWLKARFGARFDGEEKVWYVDGIDNDEHIQNTLDELVPSRLFSNDQPDYVPFNRLFETTTMPSWSEIFGHSIHHHNRRRRDSNETEETSLDSLPPRKKQKLNRNTDDSDDEDGDDIDGDEIECSVDYAWEHFLAVHG
eukprot:CAMPEP_0202724404 /NCGR_PEP_ID=MMETSP1385-20130828/173468_1 /ASSEMBLY_ACC=CAM_ASM_000861 /TAXON_ID=933848 /ORGANISM="Elphidium margaritaceum" /LENGTH=242 /DNA_ID=CAMNT_0049389983 /DNA_START=19 /DNA_END=743 /DNA_ORIENTATION=+